MCAQVNYFPDETHTQTRAHAHKHTRGYATSFGHVNLGPHQFEQDKFRTVIVYKCKI